MSDVDAVIEDLSAEYSDLARSDFEQIVAMLAAAPSSDSGMSVATALEPTAPGVASRLRESDSADTTEYLRILRGAVEYVLTRWDDPAQDAPEFDGVEQFVRNLEGVEDPDPLKPS